MTITTVNSETIEALRRRVLDEGVRNPDTLASAAVEELRRERKRSGNPSWDMRAEDLDRLVEIALKRDEQLEAAVERKATSGGVGGMF